MRGGTIQRLSIMGIDKDLVWWRRPESNPLFSLVGVIPGCPGVTKAKTNYIMMEAEVIDYAWTIWEMFSLLEFLKK